MGKLKDQMFMDLQLSGAKPSRQKAYLREAENLAKYFNKSPVQLVSPSSSPLMSSSPESAPPMPPCPPASAPSRLS